MPALLRSTILLIYSSRPISYQWWLWKEGRVLYAAQLSLQQALTNNWSFVFRKSSLALELTGRSIKSPSNQNASDPGGSGEASSMATLWRSGLSCHTKQRCWTCLGLLDGSAGGSSQHRRPLTPQLGEQEKKADNPRQSKGVCRTAKPFTLHAWKKKTEIKPYGDHFPTTTLLTAVRSLQTPAWIISVASPRLE